MFEKIEELKQDLIDKFRDVESLNTDISNEAEASFYGGQAEAYSWAVGRVEKLLEEFEE